MTTVFAGRGTGRQTWVVVCVWVISAIALVGAGLIAPARPELAVALALMILAFGVSLAEPAAIPLLILPVTLAANRVSAAGVDLTISDLALAIACVPAFIYALGDANREIRTLIWGVGIYQFATLLTVVNNPYQANVVEWLHAGVLIGGGLITGWAIGRRGFASIGLRLLVGSLVLLACAGLAQVLPRYLAGDFGALFLSWPVVMHKNHFGTILALGAIILWVRPTWLGVSRIVMWPAFTLIVGALAATQSRQAIVGLVSAMGYVSLRRGRVRGLVALTMIVVPVLLSVAYAVWKQIESGNLFNSAFSRVSWYDNAIAIWSNDPWFGVGLRWWYTPRFGVYSQPPSAILDVLTSAGVIGLAAFGLHWLISWRAVRRLSPEFGILAAGVLVVRLVQSQFDLYWVSVQASVPFLIVGICVGAAARAQPPGRIRATRGIP